MICALIAAAPLANLEDLRRPVNVSLRRLAELAGMSVRSVRAGIADLETIGMIDVFCDETHRGSYFLRGLMVLALERRVETEMSEAETVVGMGTFDPASVTPSHLDGEMVDPGNSALGHATARYTAQNCALGHAG